MVHTDDHITEKIAGYHLMHLVMILCYVAYLDNSGIINQILHTSAAHVLQMRDDMLDRQIIETTKFLYWC